MELRIIGAAPDGGTEVDRITALRALDVLDTPPEPEIDIITELAADRFQTKIALVSLVDEDRQWFKSRVGIDAVQTDRAISFCTYAIESDSVFVVLDATLDPWFSSNPLVTGEPNIRFYAGAPLVTGAGQRIGTLCIIDPEPRTVFEPRDQRALALMAKQVVSHLELRSLRRAEQVSDLIARTTTDAFVCVDVRSRIIHWNRAAEVMFGWTSEEMLGQPLERIIPARHHAGHQAGMGAVRNGGPSKLAGKTVEVPALTASGAELPVELSIGMWRDDSGKPAGFAAVLRDISARKAIEAESEARKRRLSEKLAAVEASNDGIAITDADGNFIFMNSAHALMFGYNSREELIGKHWTELYLPSEVLRLETEALPVLKAEGRYRGEIVGAGRGGSAVDQEISLSLGPEGGIVCVTRDIRARRASERERTLLREQLLVAQRHEAVGQLATGVAHDFNNLIATISGSAALLSVEGEPRTARHAERIQAACTTAANLVEKMLNFSARKREPRMIDFGATIDGVCELVRPSLSSPHRITARLPRNRIHAFADATELMQVVLNLVINARDALPKGKPGAISVGLGFAGESGPPRGSLVVGSFPRGPAAHISVTDSGCGMDPAEIPNIFGRFYTRRKDDAGTGIGLAVVSGIVTSMGGGIAVSSAPGEGTTFDVYWPLNGPIGAAAAQVDTAPANGTSLSGLSVLVVDDNPAVVDVLSELMEQAGAEVGPCTDPADALAALREDPDAWSVILTDFDMPGMDGAALAAEARRVRRDIPIILCTALPDSRRPAGTDHTLFDDVLRKPVSIENLVSATLAAVGKRRKETTACAS